MRVLHVIDSSGLYGAEIMLLNLMSEQQATGCTPILLSLGKHGEGDKKIEQECRKKNILMQRLRFSNNFHFMNNGKQLLSIANEYGVDVIHSHGYKGNIIIGSVAKSRRSLPVICTLHGWTATKFFSRIAFYEKMDKFFITRFDAIVRVSSDSNTKKNIFLHRNDIANKLFVIENGLPELSFDHDCLEFNNLCLEDDCFYIGAIGRLSLEKGFAYLVDSLPYLQAVVGKFKLIILGEGNQRKNLEKQAASLGLQDQVILPGYYDRGYNFLKKIDVFIIPSLTEGLPITLLEAMQASIPIIATQVGGIPRVIEDGETGYLVIPQSPLALAEKIIFVKKNPAKAALVSSNARHVALTKYSSRRMADDYQKVYQNVLS